MASDTSMVFNLIAKDKASGVINRLKGVAISAFQLMGGAAIKYGLDASKSAADLAETQSKVEQIFGKSAGAVGAFASKAAGSFGQSQQQALDAAATFATFGKSAGLTGDKLVSFSTDFAGLASDLASFNNTTPQQAIDAIGAALRGEAEPMRQYGVLLDDAALRQEALKLGLIKTTKDALTPQQKVLAAQAAIYKQTQTAQGDFARTSGGVANQQRILAAQLENTKAELGMALLPVILKVTTGARELATWFKNNSDTLIPLIAVVGGLVGIIWAVNAAVKAYTAVQVALNLAMSANPIGLIIIGIGALIGVIVLVATKTRFFQTVWAAVWGFLKSVGAWFAGPFAGFFMKVWDGIVGGVVRTKNMIVEKFNQVVAFFKALPKLINIAVRGLWDGLINGFRSAINFLIGGWNRLDFGIHVHLPSWLGGAGFDIEDVIPDIPFLAAGGIVTRPTLAVLGEGNKREAVIPLDRARNIGVGLGGGGGHVTITFDSRGAEGKLKTLLREWIRIDGAESFGLAPAGS